MTTRSIVLGWLVLCMQVYIASFMNTFWSVHKPLCLQPAWFDVWSTSVLSLKNFADWSAIDSLNSWNHIICQGDHQTPQIICATELDLKKKKKQQFSHCILEMENMKHFVTLTRSSIRQLFRYVTGLSSIHFGTEDMTRKGCIPLYITRQGSAGHIPESEGLHTRFD